MAGTLTGYIYFTSLADFKAKCKQSTINKEWYYASVEFDKKDLLIIEFPAFFILDQTKSFNEPLLQQWRKVPYKYFLDYISGDKASYQEAISQLTELENELTDKFKEPEFDNFGNLINYS